MDLMLRPDQDTFAEAGIGPEWDKRGGVPAPGLEPRHPGPKPGELPITPRRMAPRRRSTKCRSHDTEPPADPRALAVGTGAFPGRRLLSSDGDRGPAGRSGQGGAVWAQTCLSSRSISCWTSSSVIGGRQYTSHAFITTP